MDYYISKDPVAQRRAAEAAEMVEESTRAASQGKRLKRSRTLSKKAQEALEAQPTTTTHDHDHDESRRSSFARS